MPHFKVNLKALFFILKDQPACRHQLACRRLCRLKRYHALSEKALDLLVREAAAFAGGVVDRLNQSGRPAACVLSRAGSLAPRSSGPPSTLRAGRLDRSGQRRGLRRAGFPPYDAHRHQDLMYGACQAFNMAPSLTHGAAHLIETFGKPEYAQRFVPKMFDGTWSETMCLTEPNAGSRLAGLETTAFLHGQRFGIRESEIFISWGEHDPAENIIHLVLARIDGAPAGSSGLSLFIVPKIRVNPDGSLGRPNDVVCTGIEEKLGRYASPTATLVFGQKNGCSGNLCGEENMAPVALRRGRNEDGLDDFLKGKLYRARYWVDTALGHALATIDTCLRSGREIVEMPEGAF